ncbi:hypothetical protein FRX31_003177 [Thalictrum thalictroides]|uniref:RNase H type-1 domain-containing protein n=1 Tax=Thalictrum thalictroides TaxID=46969 RepID=A0A7J6XFL1_THATH|nr:hypothetical protein FRX31_003177 [Thalictrum thalictroides]
MAGTGTTCVGSAESTECCGVMGVVQWCLGQGVRRLEVETDNAGVASYLRGVQTNLSWCSVSILDNVLD